jgi:hypothetical protein
MQLSTGLHIYIRKYILEYISADICPKAARSVISKHMNKNQNHAVKGTNSLELTPTRPPDQSNPLGDSWHFLETRKAPAFAGFRAACSPSYSTPGTLR